MREPSWKTVAYMLAARLEHSDFCDNGHNTIAEGLEAGCPSCDDREAMRAFRAKSGQQRAVYTGETVTIDLLRAQPHQPNDL